jgi:hypothetical protein
LKRETAEGRGEKMEDLTSGMAQERVDLRSRRTTALLAAVSSFLCLGVALASFTGYVVPQGAAMVLLIATLAGFAVSIAESRYP